MDDATALFYDFDAFSSVLNAQPLVEEITRGTALDRPIVTGSDAIVLYFTGKSEIFAADTVLGRVFASHNPRFNIGGPDGVYLKNKIFLTITFCEEIKFADAIYRVSTLLDYAGMLIGRPQNLLDLYISAGSDPEKPIILQVYWSMPPKRDLAHEMSNPHPGDVLLEGSTQPEAFSRVTAKWLDQQEAWRDARARFFNSFAKQRYHDIDRLVGAANMFDILPGSAVPRDVELSDELRGAQSAARKIFHALPRSDGRETVLNALGRIVKSNLKQKVRHRAQLVAEASGTRFPDLSMVTDEAVNCRNHYVHGSDARFDYNNNFDAVVFFIDTLEFVFATSDLIECGWDMKSWCETPTGMSHPFGSYRVNYLAQLADLKALLPKPASG